MGNDYWIVGPGRLGLSLGSVLAATEVPGGTLFIGRSEQPPDHPLFAAGKARYASRPPGRPVRGTRLVLAVPDSAVAGVAEMLAGLGEAEPECVALHLSGALPTAILAPLERAGYVTGSLHPLQTVADPSQGLERLKGAYFTFEGAAEARAVAVEIVGAAGGRLLEVHAADKARYHAACVFASNYLVACAGVAARLLADAVNVSEEEAAQALRPLWRGAIANLDELGLPRALTGPVARGDVETVRGHLAALRGDTRQAYAALALQALALGRELGLADEAARAMEAEIRSTESGGTEPG
jgi:predicted short-subunit dehydrogenase-like oxidoreductase (DUF2520 family)